MAQQHFVKEIFQSFETLSCPFDCPVICVGVCDGVATPDEV